jgi:ferredoxin
MILRKIIKIDEDLCNGCGICVDACHEGAIGMVDGKAKLLRDDYCDGLGDCLPVCPTGAISFEEREALPFDEEAIKKNMQLKKATEGVKNEGSGCPGARAQVMKSAKKEPDTLACGCPGSNSRTFNRTNSSADVSQTQTSPQQVNVESQLGQWPVQIKLAPVNAPYFDGAKLLIAADCAAYAYGNFHNDFMKDKITLIGCPKLDMVDYSQKLTEIIKHNNIRSITLVRMQVPCCGGLERAVTQAIMDSGKMIPWQIVVLSTDGRIIDM